MSDATKIVGVLGGMGPAATLDFFARALAAPHVKRDQDHIRLIIDCNPSVPDRNDAVAGKGPSPAPSLAAMAQGLERAGAELLVMPCNAAHAFLAEIAAATKLPIISIIEVTVEETRRAVPHARRVGVLASSGCIDAELYQRAFAAHDIRALVPEAAARENFMRVLYRIKGGDTGASVKADMRDIASELIANGAEAVVAGCTEVPLVLGSADIKAPLVNSTDCLVAATIAAARGDIE